jgi:hypothetical protein
MLFFSDILGVQMIWTVCVPCLGFSFVVGLFPNHRFVTLTISKMSRFLRTMPVEESPPPTPSSSKDGLV